MFMFKKCPICGQSDEVKVTSRADFFASNEVSVSCERCKIMIRANIDGSYEEKTNALSEHWNKLG